MTDPAPAQPQAELALAGAAALPAADAAPVAVDTAPAAAAAEPFTHAADAGPLAAAEAPKADEPVAPAADAPVETAKDEAKPADGEAKPEEAKTEEAKVEPVVAEPVAYEFTFPEGFQADKEGIDSATAIFREHGVAPEVAQKLMDTATAAIGRALSAVPEQQQRAFADMKKGWLEQAMADPIVGGPAWKTSVGAANDVLANTALIPKSERKAFNEMLAMTGASHHPQMLKFLNRVNSFFREPAAPPPAINPPKGGNQTGGRKGAILTHPTSRQT